MGVVKILGVLRRLLSRVAPSELLRMTGVDSIHEVRQRVADFFCCGGMNLLQVSFVLIRGFAASI
jgi:hypothetical protein